jgi:hypothetical protein
MASTMSLPGVERVLLGRQLPRLSAVPDYISSTGDEAIRLAAMAGLDLLPWQQWVLRHSLGERDDGRWAAFEVGLIVGRQNGKNSCLEARELAELFLVAPLAGPRLIIHSAHQFKTALEHFRRMKRRILETPELRRRVKGPVRRGLPAGIRDSHGEESIELVDGSRLVFQARTSSGGQGAGFAGVTLLVWDEAWNLPDSVIGFVLPTLSAMTLGTPGVQVWYTSQAVNQLAMPYGLHLARVRERGTAGESGMFFAEWSVDEAEFARRPEMADDPVALAQANPSLGCLIALEHVRRERAGAMPWHEFLAHRLGIGDWPDTSAESGRVISSAQWLACAEPDQANRVTSIPTFAIDANTDQTWASIGVAGDRADGLGQFAVVEHARGMEWVVPLAAQLQREFRRSRFVIDKRGPAAELVDALKKARVRLIESSTEDLAVACGQFLDAVVHQTVRYPVPQPDLDEALAAARKAPLGDRWKWGRRQSTGADISPLVACTLALWAHRARPGRSRLIIPNETRPNDG